MLVPAEGPPGQEDVQGEEKGDQTAGLVSPYSLVSRVCHRSSRVCQGRTPP